jgi:hypothetical protein
MPSLDPERLERLSPENEIEDRAVEDWDTPPAVYQE